MSDAPAPGRKDHLYGGQAVLEGVMMRGADHWAVAVRRPDGELHIESHEIDSIGRRHPVLRKPFLRGVIVLGQSLAIGYRALTVSAMQATEEDVRPSKGTMGISLAIAMVLFVGIFVAGPAALFSWVQHRVGSGLLVNILEGVFRVALFIAYLVLIGRTKDIHRVFEYHGAEHKTIAAYEHGEKLEPEQVDRHSTIHVRCGTNFLIIVMVITIFVFALFGSPGLWWRIGSRIIAIPVIAAVAYEALRLGARFPNSTGMRGLMAPGLWMQKITTQQPDRGQIDVAIASFNEVLRREAADEAPKPTTPEGVSDEGHA